VKGDFWENVAYLGIQAGYITVELGHNVVQVPAQPEHLVIKVMKDYQVKLVLAVLLAFQGTKEIQEMQA
jgi:hypothetical protein